MRSIDEQFKDAAPETTVANIKSILQNTGFVVEERHADSGVRNCYSLRVQFQNTNIGSNGKGITKELAEASAYAELMERLQTGYHRLTELPFSDAFPLDLEGLLTQCGAHLEAIANTSVRRGVPTTKELLAKLCIELDGGKEADVLPFYNASDRCMTCFPAHALRQIYTSNGLAAGNSPEEALVQGFSEIIERYHQMRILTEPIVPPTIPDSYLCQFKTAYETICDIRAAGYDLIVKDCSLGKPFPVVASVLINKNKHTYHVHMGASPVFEIALERCLTEMFQGRNLDTITGYTSQYSVTSGRKEIMNGYYGATRRGLTLSAYPLEFFSKVPTYDFVPFADCSKKTNKDFLREILDLLRQDNFKMLVRDMSHLGFNTFWIVIPGMSELLNCFLENSFPVLKLLTKSGITSADLAHSSVEDQYNFYLLCRYLLGSIGMSQTYSGLTGIPIGIAAAEDKALFWLCMAYLEWSFGTEKQALRYASTALPLLSEEKNGYLSCYLTVQGFLQKGHSADEVLLNLSNFYTEQDILSVQTVLQTKENPFTRYLIHCNEGQCSQCEYSEGCKKMTQIQVVKRIEPYVAKFDNQAAFDKLEALTKFE